jgi:hypothetical protein
MSHVTEDRAGVLRGPGDAGGLPGPILVAVLTLFALAYLTYSAAWPEAPVLDGDSAQYLEVAGDLADGRLDTLHFRTPGYPLLLLLTGAIAEPARPLFRVSLLLHFASVWLLCVAFHRLGAGSVWVLGLCLVLLTPPYVEPAAYVMTENLAQFALVAGCAAFLTWDRTGKTRWAAVAALAWSFCGLIRPVHQALIPALIVGMVLIHRAGWYGRDASKRAAPGLVLIGIWAAVLGGYATFNLVRFQWFGVAASTGMHLTTKTIGLVERLPDEYAVVREVLIRARDAELVKRGGTHTGTQAVWAARAELEAVTGLRMPELSSYLIRMNLTLIRHSPIEYLQAVVHSCGAYWFPATGRLASMNSAPLRWLWWVMHFGIVGIFFVQLSVIVGLAVAVGALGPRSDIRTLVAAVISDRAPAVAFLLATSLVVYTMVLTCLVDIGEPRQRRATDLLLVFACAIGVWVWCRARHHWRAHVPSPD